MTQPARPRSRDEDGTLRPWEAPGNLRRDPAPHRGLVLLALGGAALLLGFGATLLVFPALLAIPLGAVVWRMAGHDLTEMRWGRMEPEGRRHTVLAQLCGIIAVLLGLLFWMPLVLLYVAWYGG